MARSGQGVCSLEGHRDSFLRNPTKEIVYGDDVQWLPWDGMGWGWAVKDMRGSDWGDAYTLKGTLTVGQSGESLKIVVLYTYNG